MLKWVLNQLGKVARAEVEVVLIELNRFERT